MWKRMETEAGWLERIIYYSSFERIRPIERIESALEDANRLFYKYQAGPMTMPNYEILDYEN